VEGLQVRTVSAADKARAIDTLVLAFASDPITRWLWPEPHQYVAAMTAFTPAFGGEAFSHGSAYATPDFGAASLWLPPGIHPEEEPLTALLGGTVLASIKDAAFSMFGQMASFHPAEPHWYLPLIGADPTFQGKGYGSALLTHALERCDRDGLVGYLEATNVRNMTLYKRHGFEEMGRIEAGGSPPLVPMLRPKRSSRSK
jgi:GNAT superfamily N-acetyltransferase